jgi:HK97 family phage prohead protease
MEKLKRLYEIKNVQQSVVDIDRASRRVKNVYSRMGNKDLDEEVIEPGAFNKTISERGPKGVNLIWHLTDHWATLKNAVGKFSEIYEEGNQLIAVTDIPKTTWGNDVLEFYATGHINQHSIGFRVTKSEQVNAETPEEYRLIKEIMLWEGSTVLWGANPNTPNISVGKSATKEEQVSEFHKMNDELTLMLKSLKSGSFTDDTFELIELRVNQTQEKIKTLFIELTKGSTEAGKNVPLQPDGKEDEVLALITLVTEKIKR